MVITLLSQSSRPCQEKRRQTGGSSSWAVRRSTQRRHQSVCKELQKRSMGERPECPGLRCSSVLPYTTDNAWVSTKRAVKTTQTCDLRSSYTDTVVPKRNIKRKVTNRRWLTKTNSNKNPAIPVSENGDCWYARHHLCNATTSGPCLVEIQPAAIEDMEGQRGPDNTKLSLDAVDSH